MATLKKVAAAEYELDLSGYLCPFPVLKAAKTLRDLQKGDKLRIIATDSGAWQDFHNFSHSQKYQLLQRQKCGDKYIFLLEK